MRIEWLVKNKRDVVVVFFNGWGMDAACISHLKTAYDVLMCYDYRTWETDQLPSLSAYRKVYAVAWSMGVWAASCVLPRWEIKPDKLIALNGTEYPVDDCYGIPEKVYLLTEHGMDERGRNKFFTRMFPERLDLVRFNENKPCRELEEQLDELKAVRMCSSKQRNEYRKWDKAFISTKDVIFPVENQHNFWDGLCPIVELPTGHNPFYCFDSWEEIISE